MFNGLTDLGTIKHEAFKIPDEPHEKQTAFGFGVLIGVPDIAPVLEDERGQGSDEAGTVTARHEEGCGWRRRGGVRHWWRFSVEKSTTRKSTTGFPNYSTNYSTTAQKSSVARPCPPFQISKPANTLERNQASFIWFGYFVLAFLIKSLRSNCNSMTDCPPVGM